MARRYCAELLGTAVLVFFGAGMATITFGFRAFGSSVAAGILLTGLTFGLVLTGLVAVIGPISGCHVNPAVTLGAFLARRMNVIDMVGYWVAQLIGGLLGALLLLWVMHTSPFYARPRIGLGANGYGALSLLHASAGGAFLIEVIITAVFVLVMLSATRRAASAPVAGLIVGFALALANIIGIPIDGASVNPARSFGPAIVVGGPWFSQLWLFIIAPLVGGVVGAGLYMVFHEIGVTTTKAEGAMALSGADEQEAAAAAPAAATTTAMPPGTRRVVSGTRTVDTGATSAQPAPRPPAGPGEPSEETGPADPPEGQRLKQPEAAASASYSRPQGQVTLRAAAACGARQRWVAGLRERPD
ncbi:MAG TPA: aquaporin [Streptosporangiaceae bacterium]|nr:aquaporin [Streptosporangiaceae bacterium]